MKVTCAHADTCLSDYWSGHHLPHVQIPVTRRKMSLAEIRGMVRSEIAQGAVMGNGEDAMLLSADFVKDEKQANRLTRAVYAAINRDIRGAKPGQRYIDTGVTEFDDCDSVYMFFVFVIKD